MQCPIRSSSLPLATAAPVAAYLGMAEAIRYEARTDAKSRRLIASLTRVGSHESQSVPAFI